MAKRKNVSGRVLRNAVPQPRDVAEFVAPRTVNEGLSVKNVFGDVGDMIDPFITAAIEKQEGLRDVSDDELKMLAALGSIPVAGAVAGKVAKKINKLVPNPKGGFIDFKRIPNNERRSVATSAAKGKGINVESFLKNNSGVIQKPKNWEELGEEGRARYLAKQIQQGKFFPHSRTGEMYYKTNPNVLDAHDYAEFMNYIEHRPDLAESLAFTGDFNTEAFNKFIAGETPRYSEKAITNVDDTYINTKTLLERDKIEEAQRAEAAEFKAARKAEEAAKLADKKAKEEAKWAEKQAKWKAEREAAARKAEEARLAKEAEQARIAKEAEEAEARRIAEEQAEAERIAREEAERKAQEEEFERQFREEEAAERNRYADSVGTALGMEAVNRDIDDWLLEKMIADEEAAAKALPITTTQVQDMSTGILPGQSSVYRGGTRPTYDHSRQFMDTELKQVPGIDRTGMSYGDNSDAFYDIYKAWRDAKNPEEASRALYALRSEAKAGKSRANEAIKQVDPYYAAGVVGDENNRLWSKIEKLRAEGKSDAKIREILKEDLDKYQGKIERLKERMPSKGHGSQFEYDGATTMGLKALPSEEARALKALGIDTPEYDELERLGNFYRVFFPQ